MYTVTRFIAYVAIVALATTKGMGTLCDVKFILYSRPLVMSCSDSDTSIRCVNPNGSASDDWSTTQACMTRLGNTETCFCYGMAQNYVIVNNNAADFEACCNSYTDYGARYC
jgi:hypothetical protein